MKPVRMLGIVGWVTCSCLAQEMVTIPKARLMELERKEAELEQLRRDSRPVAGAMVNSTPSPAKAAASPKPATHPVTNALVKAGTPLAELPPLRSGEVVSAAELLQHYQVAPAAAARRYEQVRIRVAGEVVSFDKPRFVRYAVVLLNAGAAKDQVVGRIEPPPGVANLFTTKNGTELVGASANGVRTTLAQLGQRLVVEGWCKYSPAQGVVLTGGVLVNSP